MYTKINIEEKIYLKAIQTWVSLIDVIKFNLNHKKLYLLYVTVNMNNVPTWTVYIIHSLHTLFKEK